MELTGDNILFVLRIETAQGLHIDVAHGYNLIEVKQTVHHDGVGSQGKLALHGADAMLGVIGHDIGSSDEGREVATCLTRQIPIDIPELTLVARAIDGLVHIARTTVVGRNGKTPVAEAVIERTQILGCCPSSFLRVATVINKSILLQAIEFTGAVHELPQTRSSHA